MTTTPWTKATTLEDGGPMERRWILVLLFLMLAALRLTAPSDLLEGGQRMQVGYVMDILERNEWLVQYEINGQIATKPPVYNWLAATFSYVLNSRAEWVMKLPSLLAGVGFLVCLYHLAVRFFDEKTAFYACLTCIASHHFSKLFWFARTDMLMAFTLYLAITMTVCMRATRWKSPLIGLVLGVCALTKGPVGPALYGLFLLVWGWNEQLLKNKTAWKKLVPGALVLILLSGCWVGAVWQLPQFSERVVKWQLGTRMTDVEKVKPAYYYVGHLFSRIAPWTLVAAIACIRGFRRDEWPRIFFVLVWGISFFLFFSAIPVKRHDHLLPVYPTVFLLAGYGLKLAIEPVLQPSSRLLIYPVSLGLVATPLILAKAESPMAAALVAACCFFGIVAAVSCWRSRRWTVIATACGLICAHGIYHHWGHQEGRASYADLKDFAKKVQSRADDDEQVVIFQAHPLIAYELGQHRPIETVDQLAKHTAHWLIAPDYWQEDIEAATNWRLTQQLNLELEPREDRATLYRVELRESVSSTATAAKPRPGERRL